MSITKYVKKIPGNPKRATRNGRIGTMVSKRRVSDTNIATNSLFTLFEKQKSKERLTLISVCPHFSCDVLSL